MHNPIYSKPTVTEISTKIFVKYETHKQPNFKGKAWSKNCLSTYNPKEIYTYINYPKIRIRVRLVNCNRHCNVIVIPYK